MSTETQVGQKIEQKEETGQTSSKKANIGSGKFDLRQKVNDLQEKSEDIASDFKKLERDIEKFKTLAHTIIGAMAIVFAITSILIGLDYFKNNQDRYEKFIDKTNEIKQDFYEKTEIDNLLKTKQDLIDQKVNMEELKILKQCLGSGKYYQCF